MKIFKTILWTSLFWIIVIVGLWVSSLFFPYEATIVIPAKVKSVIIADAKIEAIDNHEVVKVEETIVPEEKEAQEIIVEEEPTYEEINAEDNSSFSLLNTNQQEVTNNEVDIQALQDRVSALEEQYVSLVSELQ
ncbi:hypothetical protein IKO18_01970 [bacterium]|jgi:hypothetical protein|nr:hypothetical protein [bacterium]